jgi:phosphoribosylamine--glycine ligase
MGAYSVDSIISKEDYVAIIERIIKPTLNATDSYSGVLYAGLMLTSEGPKLIEYNARLGDPETQVVLARLKTDFLSLLTNLADRRLASQTLEWRSDAAAAVVLVASGYPGKVETGKQIFGLDDAGRVNSVKVFHAGTRWEGGKVYTAGGRVLNVTACGGTLSEALDRAYFAAGMIEFEGKEYRKDIGQKGLSKEK